MNNKITVKERTSKVCGWVGYHKKCLLGICCLCIAFGSSLMFTAGHKYTGTEIKFNIGYHSIIKIQPSSGPYTIEAIHDEMFLIASKDNKTYIFPTINIQSIKDKVFQSPIIKSERETEWRQVGPDHTVDVIIKSANPVTVIFSTNSSEMFMAYLLSFLAVLILWFVATFLIDIITSSDF